MDTIRALCRYNGIKWRKQVPCVYSVQERAKSSDDLIADLKHCNIPIPTHFVKKNLVDLAITHKIAIKKSVEKGVTESWVNKPKGLLQIAWERGLLDLESFCVEDFSTKGKLDAFGNRMEKQV